jgi:hypothetical protein
MDMEKVYVVMSYWYGTHDDTSVFGEVSKVERVVRGNKSRAESVEKEIQETICDKHNYCYTDIVDTEMCE